MKAFRHSIVWLVVVGAFCVFGFFYDGQPSPGWDPGFAYILECALFGILSWGGFGAGIATCGIAAWLLIPRIQKRQLTKPVAVFIFLGTCAISVLIPLIVMMLPAILGTHIRPFHGESGLVLFGFSFYMLVFSALAAVTFPLCVVFIETLDASLPQMPQQSVTPYLGPRCVACEDPIECGARLCLKCGYSQPR